MTTNTLATAAEPILAIDLGKYKSMACVDRGADDVPHGFLEALQTVRRCAGNRPRGSTTNRLV